MKDKNEKHVWWDQKEFVTMIKFELMPIVGIIFNFNIEEI